MKADPEKTRAWQQRGAQRYREKQIARQRERNAQAVDNAVDTDRRRSAPRQRSGNVKSRRNDGPWAHECKETRGWRCRSCGDVRHVQVDHIWPRSQGGLSVWENGLVLCGEFSRNTPGGCHPLKTAGRILIRFEWLDPDQVAWLAEVGWVAWDDDGQPYGRGWKHFAPRTVARRP